MEEGYSLGCQLLALSGAGVMAAHAVCAHSGVLLRRFKNILAMRNNMNIHKEAGRKGMGGHILSFPFLRMSLHSSIYARPKLRWAHTHTPASNLACSQQGVHSSVDVYLLMVVVVVVVS